MAQRSRMIIIAATAAALLASAFCNCCSVYPANPSAALPISAAASVSPYFVNISGDVIGTNQYLIFADFRAELVNNRTGLLLLSEPFSEGTFTVPIKIPRDAVDNDTFNIRILSLDKSTNYGEGSVTLNDTAHNRNFAVEILVVNPPTNYSGVILLVLLIVFALIIATFIIFMSRFADRMAVKRADEILIKRRMGKKGGDV